LKSNDDKIISSLLGPLRLRWDEGRLLGLILPPSPPAKIGARKRQRAGDDWGEILGLSGVSLALEAYSPFQRIVWRRVRAIPFGRTRSYGWIARSIGKPTAARAVGGALKANPLPLLIPCHRVIRSSGCMGGFSSGLRWKKLLLEWESMISKKQR